MSTSDETLQAFHHGTAVFFKLLTTEQMKKLAALSVDPTLADRVAELAEKANEGELSAGERAEYEGYIEAKDLVAILQSEARFHLRQRETAD